MPYRRLQILAMLAVLLGAGCSSPDPSSDPSWTFTADPLGDAPCSLGVQLEGIADDVARLQIVGRGITALQGIAFRIVTSPAIATRQHRSAEIWPDTTVSRFQVQPSGELWAGIGLRGQGGIDVTEGTSLARFELPLSSQHPLVTLSFVAPHSLALDASGAPSRCEWAGAKLELAESKR